MSNTDGVKKRMKNLKPWKEGESGNPGGRPLGQRNYSQIYREALIKLASLNDKSPEELENEILSSGILNARKGDYRFYKDILDRTYGMPVQKIESETVLKIEKLEDIVKSTKDILNG